MLTGIGDGAIEESEDRPVSARSRAAPWDASPTASRMLAVPHYARVVGLFKRRGKVDDSVSSLDTDTLAAAAARSDPRLPRDWIYYV